MSRLEEQLSEQFYNWEKRGRGWQVFDEPVTLEPPFRPFYAHHPLQVPAVDDGRRPTILSSFIQKVSRKLSTEPAPTPPVIDTEEEPEPDSLTRDALVEFQTFLPANFDISKEAFEQFVLNLSFCREPIAFELIGKPGRVITQFAAHPDDAPQLLAQLEAYFPGMLVQQHEDMLENAWCECEGPEEFAVEFGLQREFMFELASGKIDPFIGVIGTLSKLQANEFALFQVLFAPVQNPWAENVVRSVTHADGRSFFVNAPELADAAKNKVARPLFATVSRIAMKAARWGRMLQIARDLAGSLRVFAHPRGNELIPLHNDGYPHEAHIADVLQRQTRRSGMLLNSGELIGFVHLPSSDVRSRVLDRDSGTTKPAPETVRQSTGVLLGENTHAGQSVPVRLSREQRVQHTHIIGASGTGKSTLLFNLICQDIDNGDGVAVLDPHGDLIDRILANIPQARINDVVLVDPSDSDYPIGFNILSAHSEQEKTLIASDLVSVFRRLSASWGDQMDTVLQNAILVFLDNPRGGTLADLRRFLIEPSFRAEFLKTVPDPELIYYWKKVFPQLTGNRSVGPVLTRLQGFMSQKPIRNMISQPVNKLDFASIMDTGKIFLARLPEGLFGAQNSYMLGTLLVSKFQQIAMSRQSQAVSARRYFWLYIDEFDQFITPTMAEILKGARKYRLGLTLAHQELHQLQSDPKVASAVATHAFARIVFRVSDDDARKLAGNFSSFDANSLKKLEQFHAVARVERSDYDFNLTIRLPQNEGTSESDQRRHDVIAASRLRYGTPRAEVERMLQEKLGNWPDESESVRVSTLQRETVQEPPPTKPPVAHPKAANLPDETGSEKQEPKVVNGIGSEPSVVSEIRKPDRSLQPQSEVTPTSPTESVSETAEDFTEQRLHEAIKLKIKSEAEALNYTVELEVRGQPGQGQPDIVLTRGTRTIACEVTVTTPVDKEVTHLHQRLSTGYWHVAVISVNRKKLRRIENGLASAGLKHSAKKTGFYSPEEFISKLYDWAGDDPEGGQIERGKPRKRNITLDSPPLTDSERKAKHEEMLETLRKAMAG